MFQFMLFGMNLALLANNIGLMWVAVELATLTTVMMVGLYRTAEALEAAWKYFILGSVGIALALFGTILVYLAARPVVGEGMDAMVWTNLLLYAPEFDPSLLNIAFIFLLLGYGTKVGLAPLHAWLPDAHAEGPTPISAVLSGLLLNVALYALLRFKMLLAANPHAIAPGPLMIGLGLLSLIFAGFMLYRRRDIKRLFAYSSIEHMGIIVFAFGMAGPLGNFAGLLQMTMHSLTKSAIFFSVGHITQVKGTQRIADIGGLTESHPLLGWGLVAGVAAIVGLPPFGIFTSEFLVVSSTFARQPVLAVMLVAGLLLAFGALLLRLTDVAFGPVKGPVGPGACQLHPDVRASCSGADGGDLAAAAARRLVPAHRGDAGMSAASILADLVEAGEAVAAHSPWPRVRVEAGTWQQAIERLADGSLTLLSLWGEPGRVHMALLAHARPNAGVAVAAAVLPSGDVPGDDVPTVGSLVPDNPVGAGVVPADGGAGNAAPDGGGTDGAQAGITASRHTGASRATIAVLSIDCPANRYPSVGRRIPRRSAWNGPSATCSGWSRMAWPTRAPGWITGAGVTSRRPSHPTPSCRCEGEALHQIPVGPVHAGIIEPGHFRFTCDGETVVRLEQRLGYVHKGIDLLMSGAPLARAARLAGRVSGDSTVAYGLALPAPWRPRWRSTPPPRAVWLRAMMAELERIANHLGDFGAICNDASFSIMLAHCAVLREKVLRVCADCFGHRLMMDRIVPGGVAEDLGPSQIEELQGLLKALRAAIPRLVRLYDDTPSLQDRTVTTGILTPGLARQFGAGGYVGRASGRDFDARRDLAYAPYDTLTFSVPVRRDGDVNARVWIRLKEIDASLSLLDQLLASLPTGSVLTGIPPADGEGMAVVEAFRGDVLIWLRIANGVIDRCHLRDASWFQWPLLEAVIEGNIVADFPLCNKSFNCSYSGHDL